jgi:L-ascorbate metabolism protein UlaG (beta-lactamase superfamily)
MEPLFNQWYAWPYLISPAAAPMYIANSHCKIMQSFISAPHLHINAIKDPVMRGGPFMHYDQSRVKEVKSLLEKTIKEQALALRFADAVKTLDTQLTNEATGHSLESLYQSVPDVLKGYVELVYDLNNHPSIRFIEGLLYKSPLYNLSSQSILLSNRYDRAFAFSTPRLQEDGKLQINIPFSYSGLDELSQMRYAPRRLGEIKETLMIDEKDTELFSSLFTREVPRKEPEYSDHHVRVRYFGHACILIQSRGISILCDPLIDYDGQDTIQHFTFSNLPEKIDYVLITHNHQDHLTFETLFQIRHKVGKLIVPKSSASSVADPSIKLIMRNIGFDMIDEIGEMESIIDESVTITAVPFLGEHADLNIMAKTAYLVTIKGRSILIMADSNNIHPELYHHVRQLIGDVDMLFLGMECSGAPLTWLYGPLLTKPLARKMDQSRRFDGSNCVKAMDIIDRFHPQHMFVYAMGQEPWLKYLTSIEYTEQSPPIIESNKLLDECRRRGLMAERLYGKKEIVLEPRC